MTLSDSIPHRAYTAADAGEGKNPAGERLALMRHLSASLARSHKALVALDLGGIEAGTREQVELSRQLEAQLRQRPGSATEGGLAQTGSAKNRWAKNRPRDGAEELSRSEHEVLQALRLQAALLARARHKLLVLGNMLADPSVNYGPAAARSGKLPSALAGTRGGRS